MVSFLGFVDWALEHLHLTVRLVAHLLCFNRPLSKGLLVLRVDLGFPAAEEVFDTLVQLVL
jgi:hypothetical protein